jgi:signal transduction histidine kinase
MMRRLYLKIYATFLAVMLLFGALLSMVWLLLPTTPQDRILDGFGAVLHNLLPGSDRPREELHASVEHLGRTLPLDLAVYGTEGTRLAEVGGPLPAPPPGRGQSGWMRSIGSGPTAAILLPDGRWVVARWRRPQHRTLALIAMLGLLAGAMALGVYPIVRRITRRLERLQMRVDDLGAGDLAARVEVEGKDEVAELARSFNRAADQIQRLVNAQRTVLAGVSHELRTPLARMRMAVELMHEGERPELVERLSADIAQLDELIGELLLASRLDTLGSSRQDEEIDLLAILAEEGARAGAEVSGEQVLIRGHAGMLRRLVRNLLENARRYGAGSPVEASLTSLGDDEVRLLVEDCGPGVAQEERERIFEPFYRPAGVRERSDAGIGLGLALVRQIARHHGGEARCLPRQGGGTIFQVDLPTR